jgi:LAO/AO transport system kinase
MGDDIQTIKAGILEIADIIVVNKADNPGKDTTVKALQAMLRLGHPTRVYHHGVMMDTPEVVTTPAALWQPEVLETIATTGDGVTAVVDAIERHQAFLRESGQWLEREKERSRQEIEKLLTARFIARLTQAVPQAERNALVTAVADRRLDPYSAVAQLLAQMQSAELTP